MFSGLDPVSLQEYLNRLKYPVLLMNDDVGIVTANILACERLGIDPRHIEGRLAGEAIECINSRLPGGCGKTVHCKACTIRRTVTDTYLTSNCHYMVLAYTDCETPFGPRKIRFLISTEKLGDLVLLRIDDIQGKEPPSLAGQCRTPAKE
jgi:hypothetical protein